MSSEKRRSSQVQATTGAGRDGERHDITGASKADLGDTGQTLVEDLLGEVGQLQEDVVLLWAHSAALANLNHRRARHDITRGKILGRRGISGEMRRLRKGGKKLPLHVALALAVDEVASLSAAALGN
jgi:hypothetical protein